MSWWERFLDRNGGEKKEFLKEELVEDREESC